MQRQLEMEGKGTRNLIEPYYTPTTYTPTTYTPPILPSKLATLCSPAKGVGWGDWREGANPSFSATSERTHRAYLWVFSFVPVG